MTLQDYWSNRLPDQSTVESVLRTPLITPSQKVIYFSLHKPPILAVSGVLLEQHKLHMQTEDKSINQDVFQKLKELGFEEENILRALKITQDIEKASEIALKLADQGPEADLSEYLPKPEPEKHSQKSPEIHISPFSRPKMLFVVNGQLKMGKGKVCAQVGHAVIGAYLQIEDEARFDDRARGRLAGWESAGTPKIVVKAQSEKELLNIKQQLQSLNIGINTYLVHDAGHTQIKAGSRTVLGIGPAFPEEIDPITKDLKLL